MQLCKIVSSYSFTSIHTTNFIYYHYCLVFIKHPHNVQGTKWYLNVKYQAQRSCPFIHLQNCLKFDIKISIQRQIALSLGAIYFTQLFNTRWTSSFRIWDIWKGKRTRIIQSKKEKNLRWFNIFLWLSYSWRAWNCLDFFLSKLASTKKQKIIALYKSLLKTNEWIKEKWIRNILKNQNTAHLRLQSLHKCK